MEIASTLRVHDLSIPVWERYDGQQQLFRLRLVRHFPLLQLTDDLLRCVSMCLGVHAVRQLGCACHASRVLAEGIICDDDWRRKFISLRYSWILRGPTATQCRQLGFEGHRFEGRYELWEHAEQGQPAANGPGHASVLWPSHAVLIDGARLLVAQQYTCSSGGSDNLRLHNLGAVVCGPPGQQHAPCQRDAPVSIRFDHWLSRLPHARCWKATLPAKLEVRGDLVFVLNRSGAHTDEVQVRSLHNGELLRTLSVSAAASSANAPDPPGHDDHSTPLSSGPLVHDMALSWRDGDLPTDEEVDKEVYILEEGGAHAAAAVIATYGVADGKLRRRWPVRATAAWLGLPGSTDHVELLYLRPLCFAAHRRALYTVCYREGFCRFVVFGASDGALLRVWHAEGKPLPRIGSVCVDDVAVFASRGFDVLAYSHAGTPLASIRVPGGRPVAYLDGVCAGSRKLSVDAQGRVCVADEEQHAVHCIEFVE